MLKINVDEDGIRIAANGTIPELTCDLVIAIRELRNEINDRLDKDGIFDFFLKDVFVDLILAEDNAKVAEVLLNSISKMSEGRNEA